MNQVKILEEDSLLEAIALHDIISFDIFDTLLLRPFVNPTDLFFYIEDAYGKKGFAEARISAEQKLRMTMKETEEVHLSDIYSEIPEYKDFMQVEMDTELTLLHPNPEMFKIYQKAKELKKDIIIISDIYLSEDFIAELLNVKGYTGYKKLYVSSTWNKEKWTGNLFRVVLEDIEATPSSILHIGDNYKSDIKAAESVGFHTFYIKKVIDCYFEANPLYKNILTQDWKTSALAMCLAEKNQCNFDSYWHRFGYMFAGPICYAYTKWIQDFIQRDKDISDVVFVARDGYLLEKIFEKISSSQVNAHYVYAPRLLSLICRLDYDLSYYDCLSQMNMIIDFFAQKSGHKSICFNSKDAANQYIQTNYQQIEQISKQERAAYQNYLKQQKFGAGMIAVVDSITDKFSAQKLIGESIENPLIGLYWCVLEDGIKRNPSINFDSFQKEHYHSLASWDIMEFIMSSPESSVKTIENEKPIYNSANPFEKRRVEIFKEIEKGTLEFVDDLLKTRLFCLQYDSSFIICFANLFLENPTEDDIVAFKDIKFSLNPDHSDTLPLQPFRHKDYQTKETTFVPHSLKDHLWLYSQRHPILYDILHKGNSFQRQCRAKIKQTYAKTMRFIFRPLINGVLFSKDGFLLEQTRCIENGIRRVEDKCSQLKNELELQADYVRLLEAQNQYTFEVIAKNEKKMETHLEILQGEIEKLLQENFRSLSDWVKEQEFTLESIIVEKFEMQQKGLIERFQEQVGKLENDYITECSFLHEKIKCETVQLTEIIKDFELKTHNHIDFTYRDIMIFLKRKGVLSQKEIQLSTSTPIAIDSNDTIVPHGTIRDNTRCPRFVKKCEEIFPNLKELSFLDLGCSGGGMVLEALLRGHYALGLEGCDLSQLNQRAEWRLIGEYLKTCDITKPFELLDRQNKTPFCFDVITAWEVLEHIPQESVPQLLDNIKRHLNNQGVFVATISAWPDIDPETGINWHVNCQPFGWWSDMLEKNGFLLQNDLFTVYDLARGLYNPPHCYEEPYHIDSSAMDNNFFIVARKKNME